MTIRSEALYSLSDSILLPALSEHGFARRSAGEYTRSDESGEDRILVDARPAKQQFAVMMSYYPKDCDFIAEWGGETHDSRGFPCGPYLTFVGVQRRPYGWAAKSSDVAKASLDKVVRSILLNGLPWLVALRAPTRYAGEVDPIAALLAAYAHERAGLWLAARGFYKEMYRRLIVSMENMSDAQMASEKGGAAKYYVFVARKLGVDEERRARVEALIGAMPEVGPLPG